jgi:hypothetical protein
MAGFFSPHIGRRALSISSKERQRRLGDIVPQAHDGLQGNCCRTPGCSNLAVPPRRLDPNSPNLGGDRLGAYAQFGPEGEP